MWYWGHRTSTKTALVSGSPSKRGLTEQQGHLFKRTGRRSPPSEPPSMVKPIGEDDVVEVIIPVTHMVGKCGVTLPNFSSMAEIQ